MWAVAQMLISGSLGAGTLYLGDLIQREVDYRDYHASKHSSNNTHKHYNKLYLPYNTIIASQTP